MSDTMPFTPSASVVLSGLIRTEMIGSTTGSDGRLPPEWGDYEQCQLAGEGGMGVVYKAWHRRLHRFEAIKTLHAGSNSERSSLVERFRFEAEAAATLNHANIVPVYGVGEVDDTPFYSMKWIDGGSLTGHLQRLQTDTVGTARILSKVARAVHHAHRHGILHRDLKPGNILVDDAGEPHITDFGLAKYLGDADPYSQREHTATGQVLGTPGYMAPEQARGDRGITTAADIYGIGAILYRIMAGRAPFSGPLADVLAKVQSEPPSPPRALLPILDADLEAICLKCLEKDPHDRYPTAAALADDLDRVARGEPIAAKPGGVWAWARLALKRRPRRFPAYTWIVKLWLGIIVFATQGAIFALANEGLPVAWVWATVLAGCAGVCAVIERYMGAKFTRLPETEQHSAMIAVGLVAVYVALAATYLPFTGSSDQVLAMYPPLTAASGLALFVVGTTHWGRFFLLGIAVTALTPFMALWPKYAPLIYGLAVSACMFYWAYAVKVTFGGQSPDEQAEWQTAARE